MFGGGDASERIQKTGGNKNGGGERNGWKVIIWWEIKVCECL